MPSDFSAPRYTAQARIASILFWGGVVFEKSGPYVHLRAPKVLALLGGSGGMLLRENLN